MLSRRALVGKMAAGVAGGAVAWAAGAVRPGTASARQAPIDSVSPPQAEPNPAQRVANTTEGVAAPTTQPPWQLLHPLQAGAVVAHEWRISDLTGARDGSLVMTLTNERGRSHRVHICRNDGQPHGVVHTRRFDLLVMNGGQGDLPTEESFAQAVARVGQVLSANEMNREPEEVASALLPHNERLRLFSAAESANARLR